MFDRWRYPAALAAAVGIGFPTLAVAAADSQDRPRLQSSFGSKAAVHAARPKALTRPARQLHSTIDVQVQKIRIEQRRKQQRRWRPLPGGVSQSTLDAIASCESGGDPTAVSSGGTYRGKYQFSYSTWASVGGDGDPARASEREQDYRAALLYSRSGSSPWPNCG